MSVTIRTLEKTNDPQLKYWATVLRLLPSFDADIDDLFSAGLLGVVEAQRTYDGSSSLYTWTYWTVSKHMQIVARNEQRQRLHCRLTVDKEMILQSTNDFEDMVSCLNERQAMVFRLYLAEGKDQTEIGEILGVSKQRISQLYVEGLERVREQWLKENQ